MQNNKRTIFYVGNFHFPSGDAYAVRAKAFATIMSNEGYAVVVQGTGGGKGCFNASEYDNLQMGGFWASNVVCRVLWGWLIGIFSVWKLRSRIKRDDIVLIDGGWARYLLPYLFLRLCRKIKIVVDVVEWYDYSSLPMGKFGLYAWDFALGMNILVPKCDGIIGISSFLTDYYARKKCLSIRIPQLTDMSDAKWCLPSDAHFDYERLHLIYAGVPGRKDLIGNFILAVKKIGGTGKKICFHMLGPSREDLQLSLGGNADILSPMLSAGDIVLHGRIEQNMVPLWLNKADFSVLARPDKRYANAGFPTKLVESFSAGLPMIANLTGDIGIYLHDKKNGLVASDCSVDEIEKTLLAALSLSNSELQNMREQALQEAKKSFDYKVYQVEIGEFLSKVTDAKN